jgi:ribokinase
MSILVLGSLNMDLVVRSPRLPQPGETLTGSDFATIPGGKGANQAVAAARQGVTTAMVGRVGADDFGHQLRHALAVDGVNVEAVKVDAETHTGVAAITVAQSGENQIVIVPGTNGRVDATDVAGLTHSLAAAQLLLLQCEIPAAIVAQAAQLAHAAGVTVILDPAPVPDFDLTPVYPAIDILTPNQVEAAQLTGLPVNNVAEAEGAIAHCNSKVPPPFSSNSVNKVCSAGRPKKPFTSQPMTFRWWIPSPPGMPSMAGSRLRYRRGSP